ncbi:uncharacterized protein LACBIDRAFT_331329 [Laccaria bicolor S238N-H82]|uniref:Predicted protein n=1 Tax=Laccaria bicolor (strain S238N-H82 / ATCC MYA-4686) TaxID=486041 RepID=B0DP55_LACBS|nr:uncharacterized protein LACBIDRAFT_331329 [Laccaria bicolor S238N-H82]EDR03625.1 predicted protein [Laccaria bicolor S238N-H82]|eukprot:XP_001885773.1 predicted protein [Laccaria bicolor S238N-H82]
MHVDQDIFNTSHAELSLGGLDNSEFCEVLRRATTWWFSWSLKSGRIIVRFHLTDMRFLYLRNPRAAAMFHSQYRAPITWDDVPQIRDGQSSLYTAPVVQEEDPPLSSVNTHHYHPLARLRSSTTHRRYPGSSTFFQRPSPQLLNKGPNAHHLRPNGKTTHMFLDEVTYPPSHVANQAVLRPNFGSTLCAFTLRAANSCIMSQEDLTHSLRAPVRVVFCRLRAYISEYRFPFAALSWIHAGAAPLKLPIRELLHLTHYLHLNTPQNLAHHPQRPNPLRPLLVIVAFC